MYQFRKHEIKEKDEQILITLYLDMPNVEFAEEFSNNRDEKQEDLEKSAKRYINSKFPNIKNATVKIMAGTMIIASLAFGGANLTPAGAEAPEIVFSDVQEDSYYSDPVDILTEKEIVEGIGDGKFAPKKDVTRAEAAAMIARAMDLDTDREVGKAVFKDVSGGWYYGAIAALKEKEILHGYNDGTFKPNEPVTRAEFAKMIVEAYKLKGEGTVGYTDVKKGAWYSKYVVPIHQAEITQGVGNNKFAPNSHTSRADAATFVYRTLNVDQFGKADGKAPITNVTDTAVTINGKEFSISDNLKGMLDAGNKNALTDAVVYAQTDKSGKTVTKIRYLELNKSGEEGTPAVLEGGDTLIDGSLIVNADHLEINNVTINQDLLLGKGNDSNLLLDGVTVKGQTTVGDPNEVTTAAVAENTALAGGNLILQDSFLSDMVVHKENVTINAKGTSSIGSLLIQRDTKINVEGTSTVAQLNISKDAENVQLNGTVASLEVTTTKTLKLVGNSTIANFKIANSNSKVEIDPNIRIQSLSVPAGKESEVITNFDTVKKNIEKINTTENTDHVPASDDIPSAKTSTVEANYIGQNALEFIITVKDASGKELTDLTADDFSVKLRDQNYTIGKNTNFVNFINKGEGRYAVTFKPGFPINETVEVLANDSSIKTGLAVNTSDEIAKATANVSDLAGIKNALDDPNIKTINIVDDFETSERIIVDHAVTINGGHKSISFTGNEPGWNSNYVMQVYNTSDVTISDLSLTGGDGALLVNSSAVSLKGTIDVSGNEFGGIEVSKGKGEGLSDPSLDVTGANFVNTTEAYGKPTMWEDIIKGKITGAEKFTSNDKVKTEQVQYYINASNATTTAE